MLQVRGKKKKYKVDMRTKLDINCNRNTMMMDDYLFSFLCNLVLIKKINISFNAH